MIRTAICLLAASALLGGCAGIAKWEKGCHVIVYGGLKAGTLIGGRFDGMVFKECWPKGKVEDGHTDHTPSGLTASP